MSYRYPVFWITLGLFALVGLATWDVIVGIAILGFCLPAILLLQIGIRWIFLRFSSRIWPRRLVMLLPGVVVAVMIFLPTNNLGGRQSSALRVALAGNTPSKMRNLHVMEHAWTDYVVFAYFRCDPESLRNILESPPFVRSDYHPRTFSFSEMPIEALRDRPEIRDVVVYERTDLEKFSGRGLVYTDSGFSFAYVQYSVD